jgi:hypothetical protein
MGVNGVEQRLAKIEDALRQADAAAEWHERAAAEAAEYWPRYEAACRELSATMAPEHIALVNAALAARRGEGPWPSNAEGAPHLLRVVEDLIRYRLSADHDAAPIRPALPPRVADAYLRLEGWPYAQCRACLLVLPYSKEHPSGGPGRWAVVPEHFAFAACPDCGGRVGRRPMPGWGRPGDPPKVDREAIHEL